MGCYICSDAQVHLLTRVLPQVGFFYVVGHGVPERDFTKLYEDMRRFFALEPAIKMKVCTTTNPHNRGWTPLGEETLDPGRQSCGDTKEGFYIGRDIPPGHAQSPLPLHGPNVWPDSDLLPGCASQ